MIIEQTIDKLRKMKMAAMAEALEEQIASVKSQELSFEDRIGLIVDMQWDKIQSASLSKRLKDKLKDTQSVIASHQLFFSTLDENRLDKQLRDNAWIIQYLKHQLIRLYLEIQDAYPEYLSDDPLTEQEIHSIYFTENSGENRIIKAPAVFKSSSGKALVAEPTNFEPLMRDVRETDNTILTYSEMIACAEKFAAIEKLLFQEQLIDSKYDFIKKPKGNIKKLAAVYVTLVKKNYFNEFYFPGKMKITDLQVRKFLNYRYNATIDREFRNFRNKEKGDALLESFIDEELWIGLLPNGRS